MIISLTPSPHLRQPGPGGSVHPHTRPWMSQPRSAWSGHWSAGGCWPWFHSASCGWCCPEPWAPGYQLLVAVATFCRTHLPRTGFYVSPAFSFIAHHPAEVVVGGLTVRADVRLAAGTATLDAW